MWCNECQVSNAFEFTETSKPSNPPLYPPKLINVDTLNKSAHEFSDYLKTEIIKSYKDVCIMDDCYVCDNSN